MTLTLKSASTHCPHFPWLKNLVTPTLKSASTHCPHFPWLKNMVTLTLKSASTHCPHFPWLKNIVTLTLKSASTHCLIYFHFPWWKMTGYINHSPFIIKYLYDRAGLLCKKSLMAATATNIINQDRFHHPITHIKINFTKNCKNIKRN